MYQSPSPTLDSDAEQHSEHSGQSVAKSTAAIAGSINLQPLPSPYSSPPQSLQDEPIYDDLDDDVALFASDLDTTLLHAKQSMLKHFLSTKRKAVQRAQSQFKIEKDNILHQLNLSREDAEDCRTSMLEYKIATERSQQIAAQACVLLGRRAEVSKHQILCRLVLGSWRLVCYRTSQYQRELKALDKDLSTRAIKAMFSQWRGIHHQVAKARILETLNSEKEREKQELESELHEQISLLKSQLSQTQEELELSKRDQLQSERQFRDAMLRGVSAFQRELSSEYSYSTMQPIRNATGHLEATRTAPVAEEPPARPSVGLDSIDSSASATCGQVAVVSARPRKSNLKTQNPVVTKRTVVVKNSQLKA
ncbi:hypothetical protein GEMRC1_006838 [Eukaryota sp. GEM-RC1]